MKDFKNKKLTLSISPQVIIVILSAIIVGMFAIWQPWSDDSTKRTITVTGNGETKSTPDEFTFSPYFQRVGTDEAAIKTEINAYGKKLIADLTKLGVAENSIKLNSDNYNSGTTSIEPTEPEMQGTVVLLYVEIKATSSEQAQKVQDYLSTTDAKGQLTPVASFSKQARKKLEETARKAATKDARKQAEQTAENLGSEVGKVISIKEQNSPTQVSPMFRGVAEDSASSSGGLPITPGQDIIEQSVQVVFELR